ncbi:MAG TPA: hypothetical protein VIN09_07065 [Chloroflexota bacterium]
MAALARYLLILRANIALESDVRLAAREIAHFLGRVEPVADLSALGVDGLFPALDPTARPDGPARRQGVRAYVAHAPLARLPTLLQRLTFVQQVCVAPPAEECSLARRLAQRFPATVRCHEMAGRTILIALPQQTVFELAGLVAAQAGDASAAPTLVDATLEALLAPPDGCPVAAADGHQTIARHHAAGRAPSLLTARSTNYLTHGFHRFKARFFPRLVRCLINLSLPPDADPGRARLLDPFVGSGTALVEAALLGVPSVGVDLDPLAVLITRAKLAALHAEDGLPPSIVDDLQAALDRAPPERRAVAIPPWLMRKLSPAQVEEISDDVASLCWLLGRFQDRPLVDLLRVALSDALAKKLRFRFLGTGVGRFALAVARPRVVTLFIANVAQMARTTAVWQHLRRRLDLPAPAPAWTVWGDARALPLATDSFDVLVTSPPYLPASSGRESYTRSRALALDALDLIAPETLGDLERLLMGAMAPEDRFQERLDPDAEALIAWLEADPLRRIKASPTRRYFADLRLVLREVRRVLRPEGRAVLVVAREHQFYQFATRQVLFRAPMAEIVGREVQRAGLTLEGQLDVELIKDDANARPRSLDRYHEAAILARRGQA